MITVKMVDKYKDKYGRIIGYSLMDKKGIKKDMKSSVLKSAIQEGKIQVVNLTLTSDNRLMESSRVEKEKECKEVKNNKGFKEEYVIKREIIEKINKKVPTRADWHFVTPFEEGFKGLNLENLEAISKDVSISLKDEKSLYIVINSKKIYLGNSEKLASNQEERNIGIFENCTMRKIDLHNISTLKVTNMSSLFLNCEYLRKLDISNFDTSNVIEMNSMLEGCQSLIDFDFNKVQTLNVKDMNSIFKNCKRLKNINLSCLNTSSLINMLSMFEGCESLEELNLRNFDTSKVTNMERVFFNCSSLKSLNLSNFDTSKVITMKSMFENCSYLNSLNIEDFYIVKVKDMSNMLKNCSSLKDLKIFYLGAQPFLKEGQTLRDKDVDWDDYVNAEIETVSGMFWGCRKLESICVVDWGADSLKDMSNMFRNCESLKCIDFGTSSWVENVETMNSMFKGCKKLNKFEEEYFYLSPELKDVSSMFEGCEELKEIYIPLDVCSIITMNSMFKDCSRLREIKWDFEDSTYELKDMGFMFSGCRSLRSIDLGNFNTSKVTNMRGMFFNCESLKSLDLNNFETFKVTDMNSMFGKCTSLVNLDLWYFETINVTDMKNMFKSCTSLKRLDLSSFDISKVKNIEGIFANISGDCYIYCSTENDKKKMLETLCEEDNVSAEHFIVKEQ